MSKEPRSRLYERIADTLAAQIAEGVYPVGERLPSERELSVAMGVSRPTLREAVVALELEGLVEVRTGSGVYVTAKRAAGAAPRASQMGHFEVLEARRIIEPEAAALAARMISEEELRDLEGLVSQMEIENHRGDVVMSEEADRRFHVAIARATQNSAVLTVVELLWDHRNQSEQSLHVLDKVRATGVKPRIDEHASVLEALRRRDAAAARQAMAEHLDQVLDVMLDTQETEAVAKARAEFQEKRKRFGHRS
jgi:DNA-binding FadR family transcriptional regulator